MRLERVGYGHPDVLSLVERVQAFYADRYGTPDATPLDPSMFEPPEGSFYVGYDDVDGSSVPVATGAWRRSTVEVFGTARTAEIKRMYVVPEAQRRGLARRMLAHLEASAAAAGVEAMVLETGVMQPEAIELYLSSGYQPVPGFGYYLGSPHSRCFGQDLR